VSRSAVNATQEEMMKPAPVDLQGKHDSRNLASLIVGQDHSTLQNLSFSVKEINISSLFLVHIETAEIFRPGPYLSLVCLSHHINDNRIQSPKMGGMKKKSCISLRQFRGTN
jgi:hypothetical protein